MGNHLQMGKLRQRVGKGGLPGVTMGLGQKAALLSPGEVLTPVTLPLCTSILHPQWTLPMERTA